MEKHDEKHDDVQNGNTSNNSMKSTDTSSVSVTNNNDLLVSNKLYQDIEGLKNNYIKLIKAIDAKNQPNDTELHADIKCLTSEEIDSGLKKINKKDLVPMVSELICSVKSVCLPEYIVTKHNNNNISVKLDPVESITTEKLNTVHEFCKVNFDDIQGKLNDLSRSIETYRRPSTSGINFNTFSTPVRLSGDTESNVPAPGFIKHVECHVNITKNDFLNENESSEIINILSNPQFEYQDKNGHSVLLFGEQYKYTGGRNNKPLEIPNKIKSIMDRLNDLREDDEGAPLNSCLVNRLDGPSSFIPEHSDDEMEIDPKSSIHTVSLGCTRTVIFTDSNTGETHKYSAESGSLYTMTRRSQNFFKHQIKQEENVLLRFSLTFRSVNLKNRRSTLLLGDSNSGMLKFGMERGTFGSSIPGDKLFVPTIDDIDPVSAVGYSNVLILCGINDIRSKHIVQKEDVKCIYDKFKSKVKEIQAVCKGISIAVCPILPTRLYDLNKKAIYFNSFIFDDLVPNNWGISYVWGLNEFLNETGALDRTLAKPSDHLHLNKRGAGLLGKFIKEHFLPWLRKSNNNNQFRPPYSQVVSGAHVAGTGPRPVLPT